jgi:hypothetical protein
MSIMKKSKMSLNTQCFMVSVAFFKLLIEGHCIEWHHAESHYAECHNDERHYAKCLSAECHYGE